jgi:hypothetical protein
LILDNRLANAVHTLSEIPFLVRPNGSSYAWSPYRYAVYLHWMRLTAEQVDTQPDVLERTLFTPQRGVSDVEGDAAD